MRSRARLHGYTLVEVIAALGVLAVGATGVIALQKVTGLGNASARNLSTAKNICASWAERLKLDALQWSAASEFGDTYWLKNAALPPGQWIAPAEVAGFGSPDADILGADIYPNDPSAPAFCTQMRLVTLPKNPRAVRAEIRVFWERRGAQIECNVAPDFVSNHPERYASVYDVLGVIATP